MKPTTERPSCPHCSTPLQAFTLPENSGWQSDTHLACFNDDCPYYQRGWQHMQSNYSVKASYRYRVNPLTGKSSPLPVWSASALRDRIVGQDEHDADLAGPPPTDNPASEKGDNAE